MLLYKWLRVCVNPSKRGGIDMVLQGLAGLLWGISRRKSKRRILKCLCHYIGLFGKSTNLSFLNVFLMICCKLARHPILTENANFVTNALRGDLSTVNVRPWCGHYTCSVHHQWIVSWILPQFDPQNELSSHSRSGDNFLFVCNRQK